MPMANTSERGREREREEYQHFCDTLGNKVVQPQQCLFR